MPAKTKPEPAHKAVRAPSATGAPTDRVVLNAYTLKLETLLAASLPRDEASVRLLDELHALGELLRAG